VSKIQFAKNTKSMFPRIQNTMQLNEGNAHFDTDNSLDICFDEKS
jgi:hypothetical protein